jgi:hypothetical protein
MERKLIASPLTKRPFPVKYARMEQRHLGHSETVNYGSFYTPEWVVDIVYAMVERHIQDTERYRILDTSCGYGGFLRGEAIGADIDETAVKTAREQRPGSTVFCHNSLSCIGRSRYNVREDEKLIIIGNPPYNDATSIIQHRIKRPLFERDDDVASRDAGLSFLLAFDKLRADYVCVLHPLSYLIKKANFERLKGFRRHYRLADSLVISSGVFSGTSKTTCFPIVIAFYERCASGMAYEDIAGCTFKTHEGSLFSPEQFDTIGHYITKYPNQNNIGLRETVAFFYTLRDINALKRAATFIGRESCNTIRVTKNALAYYCYADVFKDYIRHIPYYFGNSDIMIDHDRFMKLRDVFVDKSLRKHPSLAASLGHLELAGSAESEKREGSQDAVITRYFRELLGEHYIDAA